MKIIVGLGNPGDQYRQTRHNLGFLAVERLADALQASFSKRQDDAVVARAYRSGSTVLLAKPQTFMNNSGGPAAALARRHGCLPEDLLVLVDDRHLPLGKIRLRAEGSAGGHNGLKSIAAALGSSDFHRLRLGIGADAPGGNLSAFVLGRLTQDEMPTVAEMVGLAADAALCWIDNGIEVAMNRYN